MKKLVLVLAIFMMVMPVFAVDKEDIPENVIVISQTTSQTSMQITVIDLEYNELVILVFHPNTGGIKNINRTGIIVDVEKQLQLED